MTEVIEDLAGPGQHAERFRARQLSALLQAARRRTAPPDGFGSQRRIGLTQAQAAGLLGVDVRHYQNLELARLRHPDPAFLDRAARVLGMSVAEREVLYHLAAGHPPAHRPTRANLARLQEWVDSVPGQPALVTDLAWNILAWNREEPLRFQDPAALPEHERNAILWMFSEAARARFVDVEKEYPLLVGRVRSAYLCAQGIDEGLEYLVQRLLEIPAAAEWWRRGVLRTEPVIQTRRVRRPDGTIRQVRSITTTVPHQGLRLIVFTPGTAAPGTAPWPWSTAAPDRAARGGAPAG